MVSAVEPSPCLSGNPAMSRRFFDAASLNMTLGQGALGKSVCGSGSTLPYSRWQLDVRCVYAMRAMRQAVPSRMSWMELYPQWLNVSPS